MKHTPHESPIMAVEKAGRGSTQLPSTIGFQNLSKCAQVVLGQCMIVVQLERTVTTVTD